MYKDSVTHPIKESKHFKGEHDDKKEEDEQQDFDCKLNYHPCNKNNQKDKQKNKWGRYG